MRRYDYNGVEYILHPLISYRTQFKNLMSKQNTKIDAINEQHSQEIEDIISDYSSAPAQEDYQNGGNFDDAAQSFLFEGDVKGTLNVKGKNVSLNNINFSAEGEQRQLIVSGEKNTFIKDSTLTGPFKRVDDTDGKNVNKQKVIIIDNSDEIVIDGLVYNSSATEPVPDKYETYNVIEIGLSGDELPSKVTIKNCTFNGRVSNVPILVFGTKDNAVINIENCVFENVSNVFRLSNRADATGVVVNIKNCECKAWESRPDNKKFSGFIICQDYTSTADMPDPCLFRPDKITINFSETYGPGHKNLADYETPMNSAIYVYKNKGENSGVVPFDDVHYPTINFI